MEFIGETIKKKRLAKKISINRASSELKIPVSTLNKIENDEIDEYIDRVYYLGHIRSYSNFLELDSNHLIEQFKSQHSFNKTQVHESIKRPVLVHPLRFTKYLPFAFIFIIFMIFYNLFVDVENPKNDYAIIPDIPEKFEPLVEKEILNQGIANLDKTKNNQLENMLDVEINSSSAVASTPNKDLENNTLVTLKFLNPTWVQIRDTNENIILSKLMNAKDQYIYETKYKYTITAGNAGNILVLIDNEVRGKIGNFGDVVDSIIIDSDFNH